MLQIMMKMSLMKIILYRLSNEIKEFSYNNKNFPHKIWIVVYKK